MGECERGKGDHCHREEAGELNNFLQKAVGMAAEFWYNEKDISIRK